MQTEVDLKLPASETFAAAALRRFLQHRMAVMGLTVLILVSLAAIFSNHLTSYDFREATIRDRLKPPSTEHWVGTDQMGRDLLTRVLRGGRISLQIGAGAVTLALTIGTLLGTSSGYFGGRTDAVIMRFTDVVLSIPNFFLILSITALLGPSTINTMLVLGLASWPSCARIVRAEILSFKEREFVMAAKAQGLSDLRILFRHLLPNVTGSLIVWGTLFAASAIIIESGLSFLGLGAQPPEPSWGRILSDGRDHINNAWWLATVPGLMILTTVLSLNLIGDGLRDALDVRQKKR